MTAWEWAGLVVCVGLCAYLGTALLRPDLFD